MCDVPSIVIIIIIIIIVVVVKAFVLLDWFWGVLVPCISVGVLLHPSLRQTARYYKWQRAYKLY
jgi:hypothetical protein